MRLLAFGVLAGVLSTVGCAAAAPKGATPQAAVDARPAVLVELFTSEGCSSCPPADALLGKLAGSQVPSGPLVVALSEHVTYWNQDGWVDPFSQNLFTDRQNGYVRALQIDEPYTPQAVVDGRRQLVGSDAAGISKAIAEEAGRGGNAVRVIAVKREGSAWSVNLEVRGNLPKQGVELWAAVAEDSATSKVGRGENGGRTLTHVCVARSLEKVATVKSSGAVTVRVESVAASPANASGKQQIVLFLQGAGQGEVLGAAAVEL